MQGLKSGVFPCTKPNWSGGKIQIGPGEKIQIGSGEKIQFQSQIREFISSDILI